MLRFNIQCLGLVRITMWICGRQQYGDLINRMTFSEWYVTLLPFLKVLNSTSVEGRGFRCHGI